MVGGGVSSPSSLFGSVGGGSCGPGAGVGSGTTGPVGAGGTCGPVGGTTGVGWSVPPWGGGVHPGVCCGWSVGLVGSKFSSPPF